MNKNLQTVKNLALPILTSNREYNRFCNLLDLGLYNTARLALGRHGSNKDNAAEYNQLEDILIDLIVSKEDEEGNSNNKTIRNT